LAGRAGVVCRFEEYLSGVVELAGDDGAGEVVSSLVVAECVVLRYAQEWVAGLGSDDPAAESSVAR
jgi:hypothetical protein